MGRRLLLVGGILALAAGTTGAAPSQTRKAPVLTPGERKALHIVSVRAFGDEPNGLVVIATFGGNIQRALGHGHLKTAAVAMILQPKAGSLKSAGLVTEGGGVVGQTLRKTRSPDVAVARKGNRIVFLVHGPGESQVGKILVKTVVAAPSGAGVRTTQALRQGAPSGLTDEEWALWVDAVAWSQSDVDWFATAPTDDCASLASLASWVRRTRDYQADISGQLAYWDTWLSAKIAKLKQKAAPPPARTLDDLFAVIGTDETPAVDPQAALRQLERDQAIVRRLRARAAFAVKTATTTLAALNAKIAANCGGKAPPPLAAFKVTLDAGYDHTTPGPPGDPSTVCADISTDPPTDGTWKAEITWADGSKSATGTLKSGKDRVVFGIPNADTYHLKVTVDDGHGNEQVAEAVIPVPAPDPAHPEDNKTKSCAAPPAPR